ncbi:MAG: response regulator [Desulfatitalea sp.]
MTIDLLLVDDEEGIRKVLTIALADRGYCVHAAADGRQALALFEKLLPPIVLTDIKMPGMDGIELLKALKRCNPDVEVIMITGHGDSALAIESLKNEATDYIVKPIDDQILEVALKRAQDRIRMRDRLRHYTENLERLVEEKTRRLLQAERMAAVGETVAGLAHAIKNITSGLKGGVFVVEKGLTLNRPEYRKQGWRMTCENVERIEQLSLDLLNLAKPEAPIFKPTDPGAPLRAVYELIRSRAEQLNIRLTLDCPPTLPIAAMHAESIHRALLNLATNALDACEENRVHCPDPAVAMGVAVTEEGLSYRISDQCGGMDEAVRDKLFKGLITTKGSRGTGIGLMLTRKIVESHGGRIEVSSIKGQGSLFTIWLPLGQIHASKPGTGA